MNPASLVGRIILLIVVVGGFLFGFTEYFSFHKSFVLDTGQFLEGCLREGVNDGVHRYCNGGAIVGDWFRDVWVARFRYVFGLDRVEVEPIREERKCGASKSEGHVS